jgi:hypothetical protein
MDETRAAALGEIAAEAGVEHTSFLTDAGGQFTRFLEDNADRLRDLDGLVLIDDEPDYLAIKGDGTFLSRTRAQNDDGEWASEEETIKSGAELVEIYNPADLYAAFADAAREDAGLPPEPTATKTEAEQEGAEEADDDEFDAVVATPKDKPDAARLLYDLALTFQERSQRSQSRLLDQFEDVSDRLAAELGDSMIADEEDERVWYRSSGAFEAEIVPAGDADEDDDADEDEGKDGDVAWQSLATSNEVVQFYDPTDLFGDLAEAVAETYPEVAPELDDGGELEDGGGQADSGS